MPVEFVHERWQHLKRRPLRQLLIPAVLFLSVSAGVWACLERDVLTGIVVFAAFFGPLSFALQYLPARPSLQVTPWGRDGATRDPVVGRQLLVRPVDVEAIVAAAREKALSSMPAPRAPRGRAGSPFAPVPAVQLHALVHGMTEEDLRKFEAEVDEFEGKLRRWLEIYVAHRTEHLREFYGSVRVEEMGSAPADHLRLRLRWPEGFDLATAQEPLPEPPRVPRYSRLSGLSLDTGAPLLGPISRERLSGLQSISAGRQRNAPRYSHEGGEPVITFDLGRLNQSDRIETPRFELRSAPPGRYAFRWEVTAEGLRRPATGSIEIEVAEAKEGAPIRTLDEVQAEREALGL